jgi:hypothetical protein
MPSCIAASKFCGDGVNLDMPGTWVSWNMGDDAAEYVEGEPIVPWGSHGPGNWPTRGCPMAMETNLACLSTATALFAASFFSFSALPRFSVCRRSTSATHAAFVITAVLSLEARGFLAFGTPSSVILFGGMVVEEKRRSCNYGGFRREKWVYAAHFGGK